MLDLSPLYDKSKRGSLRLLRAKIEDPSLFGAEDLRDLALACYGDMETFFAVFFLATEGYAAAIRPFHRVIFDTLDRVDAGEITRLIINIPPGFGKTHVLKMWVARSYLREGRCRFLHLSFSKTLVDDNSDAIKAIMETPLFQAIRRVVIRHDARGKGLWKTTEGGVFRAAPTGGQVTGFRAGRLGFYGSEETEIDQYIDELLAREAAGDLDDFDAGDLREVFSGAAIIDDPTKPEDANSRLMLDKMNQRFPQTIASRLATEETPIVLIMQRVDGGDLSGYLLGGGSGEKWYHLVIPDEIRDEDLDPSTYPEYKKAWLYGIPVQHNLPLGPIWPRKLSAEGIAAKRQNDITYMAQYRQRPKPRGGRMFRRDWFPRYQIVNGWDGYIEINGVRVKIDHFEVFADTAQKTSERHDYSVLELYAKLADGRIALIDMIRGKYEAPELQVAAETFLDRYEYCPHHWSMGWRRCMVEDKVSGTGLIQAISRKYGERVEGKQRNRDKYVRACDAQPKLMHGKVLIPEHAMWLEDFLSEVEQFSRDLNHDHDDQVDPLFDACEEMIDEITAADYSQFAA